MALNLAPFSRLTLCDEVEQRRLSQTWSIKSMISIFRRIAFLLILLTPIGAVAAADSSVRLCPQRNSDEYYFAKGGLSSNGTDDDQFSREWYSKHLRAMSELSLSCGPFANEETYRFTWLRTFHHPIAVRITRSSVQTTVEAIELRGKGGYEPGQILRRTKKLLTPSQWNELLSALEKSNFLNAPVEKPTLGLDGARWIVEARRSVGYRVVDRWTPESGAYRSLGLSFLKLAGWTVPEEEIY